MDEQLHSYLNRKEPDPPVITERLIVEAINKRHRRTSLILLAWAGLLWTVILYGFCFWVGRENQAAGIALLCVVSIGYICAGCLAGFVLASRKVRV